MQNSRSRSENEEDTRRNVRARTGVVRAVGRFPHSGNEEEGTSSSNVGVAIMGGVYVEGPSSHSGNEEDTSSNVRVARTGVVRAEAPSTHSGNDADTLRNVRVAKTGVVRVVGMSTDIHVDLCFKGKCRTPKIAGAGCLVVINKGHQCFPRNEPIEDRVEIRQYPREFANKMIQDKPPFTFSQMEYLGFLCGLTVVLEHIKNTSCRFPRHNVNVNLELEEKAESMLTITKMRMTGLLVSAHGHRGRKDLITSCAKVLDEIKSVANSFTIGYSSRGNKETLDRLVNEAISEERSWYTTCSNADLYGYGHS